MWILTIISLLLYTAKETIADPTMHSNTILKKLIEARGEVRDDYPNVKVISRIKNIASYSPMTNEILIEQKAYDHCMEMGDQSDDALAFLIGHEMTHFFQHKAWQNASEVMFFFQEEEKYHRLKENEQQADLYGAFQAYLAGYDYYDIAPEIIHRLYSAYRIDPNANGVYPLPEVRAGLTRQVCHLVHDLALLYESANYLQLIGEYDWSQSIYTYLLQFLDFPEIYNNAGTNQLRAALAAMNQNVDFPLTLIYKLDLRDGLSTEPKELLAQAHNNLTTAIHKNPSEHSAFINFVICLILQEEQDQARNVLDQLQEITLRPIFREQVAFLSHLTIENKELRLDSLYDLLPKLTVVSVQQNCQNTIDLLEERSSSKQVKDFSVSSDLEIEVIRISSADEDLILIDQNDVLFPLTAITNIGPQKVCRLKKGSKTIQILIDESKVIMEPDHISIKRSPDYQKFEILLSKGILTNRVAVLVTR